MTPRNETVRFIPVAASGDERDLLYANQEKAVNFGRIGYLRIDFGKSGEQFWYTWFEQCGDLKTQTFKDELDDVINYFREDGNMLHSLKALSNFCHANSEARFVSDFHGDQYGFKVLTDQHCYYIRGIIRQGDYNAYVMCYQRSVLEQFLAAAKLEQPGD